MLWFKKRDQYKFNATGLMALGFHMAETGEPQFQRRWVEATKLQSTGLTVGVVVRLSLMALILSYVLVYSGVMDACLNWLSSRL